MPRDVSVGSLSGISGVFVEGRGRSGGCSFVDIVQGRVKRLP